MDFFSSGFQQLFNDLAQDLCCNGNYVEDINNNSCTTVDPYHTCDYYSYLDNTQEELCDLLRDEQSNSMLSLDKDLELCLDYLLPLDDETHSEQSQSDWEINFLDNYVEIPELVQILPEKTPLCSDSCDLFLKDATENLNLFRRPIASESDLSERTYPCTYGECTKIYAKPAHLKAHLRRHMGEKPYICNWPDCTWKFSRSDELARHRRSHSGVKPYKCNYCTKCFARSDHLAKHRKVHERRLLAITGKERFGQALPASVFNVRPGRKPKNPALR